MVDKDVIRKLAENGTEVSFVVGEDIIISEGYQLADLTPDDAEDGLGQVDDQITLNAGEVGGHTMIVELIPEEPTDPEDPDDPTTPEDPTTETPDNTDKTDDTTKADNTKADTTKAESNEDKAPKTGDTTSVMTAVIPMGFSLAAVLAVLRRKFSK